MGLPFNYQSTHSIFINPEPFLQLSIFFCKGRFGFPFRVLENGLNAIARRRTNIRSGQVRIIFAIFGFFLSFVMLQNICLAQASAREVSVVNVSGTVDPGMAAFIKRALGVPTDDPDPHFVFEMDTFGGRVDSALQIVDTLLSAPEGKTIAFVQNKAISAGALIALACSIKCGKSTSHS